MLINNLDCHAPHWVFSQPHCALDVMDMPSPDISAANDADEVADCHFFSRHQNDVSEQSCRLSAAPRCQQMSSQLITQLFHFVDFIPCSQCSKLVSLLTAASTQSCGTRCLFVIHHGTNLHLLTPSSNTVTLSTAQDHGVP
jgi:hypothetical protein